MPQYLTFNDVSTQKVKPKPKARPPKLRTEIEEAERSPKNSGLFTEFTSGLKSPTTLKH